MCKFKSALVMQNGDIVQSSWTNSHEDLIDICNIKDNGIKQGFVRIEYVPSGEPHEIDKYELNIDERTVPDWFELHRDSVINRMNLLIKGMLVNDKRKLLLGGQYIVYGNAKIDRIKNANIVCVSDSVKINRVYDSATIGKVHGSAKINDVYGLVKINRVYDSATIDKVHGSAKINDVYGLVKINTVSDSATINTVSDSATINTVSDSATIGSVFGSATIGNVFGSATIGSVCDSAKIGGVYDSATINKVFDSAAIGGVYDSAIIKSIIRVGSK